MKLLFIDPKCPTTYEEAWLNFRAMGGTEATIVRLTKALAVRHEVIVLQHNRGAPLTAASGVIYAPLALADRYAAGSHHMVFVQKAQNIPQLAKLAPRAKLWLWLHNFVPDETPLYWLDHLRHRLGIVCVSRTHAHHVERYIGTHPVSWLTLGRPLSGGIQFQYNPLDALWTPRTGATRDPHKLVFFSSPHKGLERVLQLFSEVHDSDDRWRLYVADPGYYRQFDSMLLNRSGLVNLGKISPGEVKHHLEEAFCVFYPQLKQPETFGLVYAEANAVGTPVLAHNFGAASEILHPSNPPFDLTRSQRVLDLLKTWENEGAPSPCARIEFGVKTVCSNWERMFENSD